MSPNPIPLSAFATPRHVAIIMDGNGRWASARGLPRGEGHRRGVEALRKTVRAAEMECDAVLKATNVDGVYSADPKKHPKAERYDRISLQEAFDRDLKVLDATAFALARENSMPIIVFSIEKAGAIEAVLRGKGRSTVVSG